GLSGGIVRSILERRPTRRRSSVARLALNPTRLVVRRDRLKRAGGWIGFEWHCSLVVKGPFTIGLDPETIPRVCPFHGRCPRGESPRYHDSISAANPLWLS